MSTDHLKPNPIETAKQYLTELTQDPLKFFQQGVTDEFHRHFTTIIGTYTSAQQTHLAQSARDYIQHAPSALHQENDELFRAFMRSNRTNDTNVSSNPTPPPTRKQTEKWAKDTYGQLTKLTHTWHQFNQDIDQRYAAQPNIRDIAEAIGLTVYLQGSLSKT